MAAMATVFATLFNRATITGANKLSAAFQNRTATALRQKLLSNDDRDDDGGSDDGDGDSDDGDDDGDGGLSNKGGLPNKAVCRTKRSF